MATHDHVVKALLALGFTLSTVVGRAAVEPYRIDRANSQITIGVGKAGALSFVAGHTHEVVGPIEGAVQVDRDDPSRSHLRLMIQVADLKVSDRGEPPGDVPKVQEAMDSDKVLDIERHPQILFESSSIKVTNHRADTLDLEVTGPLTIRDATHPITAPVHAEFADNGLTVTGRFSIKQTTYNIRPITVAGVVTVKDTLDIRFTIRARR